MQWRKCDSCWPGRDNGSQMSQFEFEIVSNIIIISLCWCFNSNRLKFKKCKELFPGFKSLQVYVYMHINRYIYYLYFFNPILLCNFVWRTTNFYFTVQPCAVHSTLIQVFTVVSGCWSPIIKFSCLTSSWAGLQYYRAVIWSVFIYSHWFRYT